MGKCAPTAGVKEVEEGGEDVLVVIVVGIVGWRSEWVMLVAS